MFWFFIALSAPALSAIGNYIDRYLLVKRETTGGIETIVLLSCFLGIIILPISIILGAEIFSLHAIEIILLLINGVLTIFSLMFYLYAMEKGGIVFSIPILQTIPVFGFTFGFFILGETLSLIQIVGAVTILIGATILSIEINDSGKIKIKSEILLLVLGSSLLIAFTGVIFKLVAEQRGYWSTQFWEYVGIMLLGIILFIFAFSYRSNLISVFKNNRLKVLGLNTLAEVLMVGSDLLLNFAVLLAPVALVYTVNSFHPFFIFIYGILIAHLFSWASVEKKNIKTSLIHKLISVSTMILGSIILFI